MPSIIVDGEYIDWLQRRYGMPVAAFEYAPTGEPIVLAVGTRPEEFRGVEAGTADIRFSPMQRDSARYWQRHRQPRGPLGWDRGVLVDGGIFPHVLKNDGAHAR